MTIALGGFHTGSRAMALVRSVVRARRRNLTLIGSPSTLDADLLIATGCVSRIMLPYVGVEGMYATAPFFRRAAESGSIDVREVDEGIVLTMFKAARQGLDFLPWKGGVGTSLPELNKDLKVIEDPFTGKPVWPFLQCPDVPSSMRQADPAATCSIWATRSATALARRLPRASSRSSVWCRRTRRQPERTTVLRMS